MECSWQKGTKNEASDVAKMTSQREVAQYMPEADYKGRPVYMYWGVAWFGGKHEGRLDAGSGPVLCLCLCLGRWRLGVPHFSSLDALRSTMPDTLWTECGDLSSCLVYFDEVWVRRCVPARSVLSSCSDASKKKNKVRVCLYPDNKMNTRPHTIRAFYQTRRQRAFKQPSSSSSSG